MTKTALLLIDLQKGFDDSFWGVRNNPQAEDQALRLLKFWRTQSWPIVHVRHCSTEAGSPLTSNSPGCAFKEATQPIAGEKQFEKNVNSAFIGTGLEEYLHSQGINNLVIAGLTTDHCVSTTTRMAGNLGFGAVLVSDATATFDRKGPDGQHHSADEIHAIHLASLNQEFCQVMSTVDVLINMSGPVNTTQLR